MAPRTASTRRRSSPAPSARAAREEIAKVAYELYERRGRQPGRELEDWTEAERVVNAWRRGRLVPGPRVQ